MIEFIIKNRGEEVISEKHQKDFKKDDENVEDENNENQFRKTSYTYFFSNKC